MNIDKIIDFVYPNLEVKNTVNKLSESKHIIWKNIKGSSFSLMSLLLFMEVNKNGVIVVDDKEEAIHLLNELEQFPEIISVYLLASSFKRSVLNGQFDAESNFLRTDAVKNFYELNDKKVVLITWPEAFVEKVFDKEELNTNTLKISVGEQVSLEFIVEVLQEYEFELTDFVYQPGQYSIRGGIVDVFSYATDTPIRIDFFGDEVESIRLFDVDTQLSKGKVDAIEIIPNLTNSNVTSKRISFIKLLLQDSLVILRNPIYFYEKSKEVIKSAYDNKQLLLEKDIEVDDYIITFEELETLQDCVIVQRDKSIFDKDVVVGFNTSIQPEFNKNFDLLAEDLIKNTEKGYRNIIVSEQQKQVDRLLNIFKQKNTKVNFTSIFAHIHEGFVDHNLKIAVYTDHQIFDRFHKFHLKSHFGNKDAITLNDLNGLHPGDYVVHIDHGIGKFDGLQSIDVNGKKQEAIRLIYRDNDILYVNIHSLHRISKYRGKDAIPPKIHKLGSGVWNNLKQKTKSKVKDIARDLIKLYADRQQKKGYSFSADSYLNEQLEASFIYEDTPDQNKTTNDVKADMESEIPMDRLVCGDVGFGKTEIAIRAAFKAVCDNKQVAVLVPTTILAFQHYKTFCDRLKKFPVKIEYLSRMRTAKEQRQIIKELSNGAVDIIIGTHRLIGKDIKFKDLGLLIVDEEQKFGVAAKEKIRAVKSNVDTLTLTATPIPRTLQFSLLGARDLSIIRTAPPNRYPITTELQAFNEKVIKDAINYELTRNGQVFFVNNRIKDMPFIENMINRLCPEASTKIAHGQLDGKVLEKIMLDFIDEKYDVLISTTIIEAGLDIPNVNTIIINNAQNYGLSDLHQLRGRVGRSNKKAFCYLLTPPVNTLPNDARRRLEAIEMFSELGSGFNIAMQDLDIRGAGNMLGGEQSGFIADIGLDTYQKILDEAMLELKYDEFSDVFKNNVEENIVENWVVDCVIETDLEIGFPVNYIRNVSERMRLYKELDGISDIENINVFKSQIIDRFGKLPKQSEELFSVVELRLMAKTIGVEKIIIKNKLMFLYFISNKESKFYESDVFGKILYSLQSNPLLGKIEEKNNKLRMVVKPVNNILNALEILKKIT